MSERLDTIRRHLFFVLFLALFATLIACGMVLVRAPTAEQRKRMASRPNRVPTAAVAAAAPRALVPAVEEMANVRAPVNVILAPKTSGRIETIAAQEGDSVAAGQLLIAIDPAEVQAHADEARAELRAAEFRLAQARI